LMNLNPLVSAPERHIASEVCMTASLPASLVSNVGYY
jgi:hypothetical protein